MGDQGLHIFASCQRADYQRGQNKWEGPQRVSASGILGLKNTHCHLVEEGFHYSLKKKNQHGDITDIPQHKLLNSASIKK